MAALLVAGAVAGAGASTAAFAASGGFAPATPLHPSSGAGTPDGEAIPAPPGVIPGAPAIVLLDEPESQTVSSQTRLSLDDRPAEATHVRVTITPLSGGSISWGTDPAGNNPRSSVGADEITASRDVTSWSDFPLGSSTDALYLDPAPGMSASVTVQFLHETPTRLSRNARGQTYGVEGGPDGAPDLILVSGVAPDGSEVQGYALNTDLNAFSPDHPGQPSNPEEALTLQAERDATYPNGWDIPVFKSDGTTRIGTFHIG